MFGMNDPSKPVTLESLMAMLQQGQPQPQAAPTGVPGAPPQTLAGLFGKPQEAMPTAPITPGAEPDPSQGAAGSLRGLMGGAGPRPNSVAGLFGKGGSGKGGVP